MPRRIRYRNPDIHGHLHQLATGKIVYIEAAEIVRFVANMSRLTPPVATSLHCTAPKTAQVPVGIRRHYTTLHYITLGMSPIKNLCASSA